MPWIDNWRVFIGILFGPIAFTGLRGAIFLLTSFY